MNGIPSFCDALTNKSSPVNTTLGGDIGRGPPWPYPSVVKVTFKLYFMENDIYVNCLG